MNDKPMTMRDAFISTLCDRMANDDSIFFVTADFGAPALDMLIERYPKRFLNVGIAEQNLVNVATGLALEGHTVYAYGISAFLTMRAYEQIRNLSLLTQVRPVNVNLVGVGAGLSYDMAGPSHHCIEDISIIRTLPNVQLLSPCDNVTCTKIVDYTIKNTGPKYIRLDGKPLPDIHHPDNPLDIPKGYAEVLYGDDLTIYSTGYMTHLAITLAKTLNLQGYNIGVIDVFNLNPTDIVRLISVGPCFVLQEGKISAGGLDSYIKCESTCLNYGYNKHVFMHEERGVSNDMIDHFIKSIKDVLGER